MLQYPNIDPVIFSIGPLAIRWYSLAYVVGIVFGCLYADYINKKFLKENNLKVFDDFMTYAVLGIVLGGRIGYVIFYNLPFFAENPAAIFKLWEGGMSFHGGLLGFITATILYCRKFKVKIWVLLDLAACATPIGLFFGRIANFINGELYGRVTDASIGMVFPNGGDLPRHPSQLYEAFLEGLVLFIILYILAIHTKTRHKPGMISGLFLIFYGSFRFVIEYFREADIQIGLILDFITMGQILCLAMVVAGFFIILLKNKNHELKS